MNRHLSTKFVIVAILLAAFAVNMSVGLKLGIHAKMESDPYYFLDIAKNLAAGKGYAHSFPPWSGNPTMTRLPGWTGAVAAALIAFPTYEPDSVMRVLNLAINSCVALVIALLCLVLFKKRMIALLSGFLYIFHPTALYLAYSGDSEPLFILLAGIGTLLLLVGTGEKSHLVVADTPPAHADGRDLPGCSMQFSISSYVAFLFLGLSCLVRVSFVLWLLFFMILVAVSLQRKILLTQLPLSSMFVKLTAGALLFVAPATFWAYRNYTVSGHFPVLSTLRGQTFYGGNNAVVTHDLKQWGYWIFPDRIPSEAKYNDINRRMTEYEVDRYYSAKGMEFIRHNQFSMPGLLAGKLVRAYLPVPWSKSMGTITVCAFRWILYITAILGMRRSWKETACVYRYSLVSMIMANIALVLVFWGCSRFSFELEPFLMPFSALFLGELIKKSNGLNKVNKAYKAGV